MRDFMVEGLMCHFYYIYSLASQIVGFFVSTLQYNNETTAIWWRVKLYGIIYRKLLNFYFYFVVSLLQVGAFLLTTVSNCISFVDTNHSTQSLTRIFLQLNNWRVHTSYLFGVKTSLLKNPNSTWINLLAWLIKISTPVATYMHFYFWWIHAMFLMIDILMITSLTA